MNFPAVAFCIEQTLGHRAHTANIAQALGTESRVAMHEVTYTPRRQPLGAPWAVTASRKARATLRDAPWDVAFLHTQSVALFANSLRNRDRRYVVSVDATPRQLDTMGATYAHASHPRPLEAAKRTWYRHVFAGAEHIVAWSEWAARSLQSDYDVPAERMTVVHPGARQPFFDIPRPRDNGSTTRILFVGGDFQRKGGHDLLEALSRFDTRVEATFVTDAEVPQRPGVTVLRGVTPGSPALLSAFASADIFCLPTHGDCTPVVVAEAMASGLPVVTTSVGSNPDIVQDGATGLVVPPGDVAALEIALAGLIQDPTRRQAMGRRARDLAGDTMHADRNASQLLRIARECAP